MLNARTVFPVVFTLEVRVRTGTRLRQRGRLEDGRVVDESHFVVLHNAVIVRRHVV